MNTDFKNRNVHTVAGKGLSDGCDLAFNLCVEAEIGDGFLDAWCLIL